MNGFRKKVDSLCVSWDAFLSASMAMASRLATDESMEVLSPSDVSRTKEQGCEPFPVAETFEENALF